MSRSRSRAAVASLFAIVLTRAAAAERLPIQADVDSCAIRASDHGDTSLSGAVRLQILTRANGKVYAAFVHSAQGINDRVFEYCLASNALFWEYAPVGLDVSSPFPISVVPGGGTIGSDRSTQSMPQVFLPSAHPDIPDAPLDVPRAQGTLNVLDDASPAEHGQAALAVREYPEAITFFRAALAMDANDRLALRGLAQALAESKGDLAEARRLALQLVTLAPDSVVGAEAMLRVCWADADDGCVYDAWKRARQTRDVAPRSRILEEELKPLVEKSAARLRAAAEARRASAGDAGTGASNAEAQPAASSSPADPCGSETAADRQAICEVKRCLDAGSILYAQELSTAGLEFQVSDWRFKPAGVDRLLATRPIASKPKEGAEVQRHDAIFLVKIGEKFSIQPSSADARALARAHNACAPATPPPVAAPSAPAQPAAAPTPTPAEPTAAPGSR